MKKQMKKVLASGMLVALPLTILAQSSEANPRQNWGLKPLGPNVPALQVKPAEIKRPLQSRFKSLSVSGERLVLAQNARPHSVLVVPADSGPRDSSRVAASVLQDAWQKISGAKIPIILENKLSDVDRSKVLISLGETELAKTAGVSAQGLDAEGYRLETRGRTLFIIGNDQGKGFAVHGTRNGAYALLERHFGYRWLWPGELGEVFTKKNDLVLDPLNEQDEPALPIRGMRNGYPVQRAPHKTVLDGLLRLNRDVESYTEKKKNSGVWFDAMGLGRSTVYSYGHAFSDIWEKYGETHPEYFALQPDGTRDQEKARSAHRPRLDVSNKELIQRIADDVIQGFRENPNRESASISPNDGGPAGFCMCEVCRRLDPPNAPKITANFGDGYRAAEYVSLSDRYVTFYAEIAKIVQKEFPDRILGSYAYSAYRTPPLYAKLPDNVLVGFVGLTYLNEEQRQTNLRDWDAWTRATDKLLLRPNAFHIAHGFPVVFTKKLADDLRHCYQTGMLATDFDSVMHNWAGHGLNYYVLAKLLWDPSLDAEKIIDDYCQTGFGKAAGVIREYFNELEMFTNSIANDEAGTSNVEDDIARSPFYNLLRQLTVYYTDEKIDEFQAILDRAKIEADGDAVVLQRINFLEQGWRFARAEVKPLRIFMGYGTDRPGRVAPKDREKLLGLLQQRQDVLQDIYDNHFYAHNVIYPLRRETSMWRGYGWNPGNEN